MIAALALVALTIMVVVALVVALGPRWRPSPIATWPTGRHSVTLGLNTIVVAHHEDVDWAGLRAGLDAAHANVLSLSAGRVEWTAFDWPEHPGAAALPGTDHLAWALQELGTLPDGTPRLPALTIDALVPNWILEDPSVAGHRVDGTPSVYAPSATAIQTGPVGQRYVDYAVELATRYKPMQIVFTELRFDDETFGADDLALFRQMTGAADWPRDAAGQVDQASPEIARWRSEVISGLLQRVRTALDGVAGEVGHRVELGIDVRVDWDDPAAGRPEAGHDYRMLSAVADRLELWAYFGTDGRDPDDVGALAAGLAPVLAPHQYTISVGLWSGTAADAVVPPAELAAAVGAAGDAGSVSTNVTPGSLMSPAHWESLAGVWTQWPT
ncbi:MAG: hypothetical protein AAGC63_15210 [Propionicimonas sp.]|nr:hypothetical protein [Propionicimonas sp.]